MSPSTTSLLTDAGVFIAVTGAVDQVLGLFELPQVIRCDRLHLSNFVQPQRNPLRANYPQWGTSNRDAIIGPVTILALSFLILAYYSPAPRVNLTHLDYLMHC